MKARSRAATGRRRKCGGQRRRCNRANINTFAAAPVSTGMIPRTTAAIAFSFLALFALTARAADEPKKVDPNEQYVLGPDSKPQDRVPKGVVTKYEWKESKNFPGTIHDYWVYVPAEYEGKSPACVFVCQDGIQYKAPTVFDNLIAKKQMPVTIGIFINPGYFPPKEGEPAKK